MKKALVILCLLGLALPSVQAQSMRDYDRGIIFSFSGLSWLGADSYLLGSAGDESAYGIGGKKYLSSGKEAIRLGIAFSRSTTEDDDPDFEDYVGYKITDSGFGFTVDYLKDLNQGRITPFMGAGLGYVKKSSKEEYGHSENSDYGIHEESESGFLLRGIIGVEVYLRKNISLSGEYQASFFKGSSKQKDKFGEDTIDEEKYNLTEMGIGSSGILNLTVYLP